MWSQVLLSSGMVSYPGMCFIGVEGVLPTEGWGRGLVSKRDSQEKMGGGNGRGRGGGVG